MDGAVGGEERCAGFGVVGEEEEAAGAGPEVGELGVVEEDVGGVGLEAAEPGAVDAAVDEQDGRGCCGV